MTHRRADSSNRRFDFERLEVRQLMSADIRSIDGTGNNLLHVDWGSVGVDLLRKAAAAYADGISSPSGANRPNAREISNVLSNQAADVDILNDRNLSAFIYAWGQFIDHDMDLTGAASPRESFNIPVSSTDTLLDPTGSGLQQIFLSRSQYNPATGTSTDNPRQQVNTITAWIDGSMIYGSDETRAKALRTLVGGKLRTSAGDMLPFNTDLSFTNANDAHIVPDDQLYVAGDVRANENIELTSLHTLFLREHNRLADQIASQTRGLSDEQIYQRARAIVIAEIQSITYNEFLPALFGRGLARYRGYNPSVNPGITTEFSTAGFRLGHSMIGNDVEFLDNDGEEVRDEMSFINAFFNPTVVGETGIAPILKYLASDRMQEVDPTIVDPLRNFLFGPAGAGGLDLASLNIQRGRDHGLADYNTIRAAYGLPKVTSFDQITSDPVVQQQLQDVYGSVDNIDVWVGGLAEDHVQGGSVGPLFQRIIADQFARLRDGDRFWFEKTFSGRQLASLENTTLADIIERNSTVEGLQDDVFFFNPTITGTVFVDLNGNGRQNFLEFGLPGITVQLLDADNNILETTTTRFNGSYSFDGLDIGTYQVREVLPAGWKQVTVDPAAVAITNGTTTFGVDFGNARIRETLPAPSPSPLPRPGPWNPGPGRGRELLGDLIGRLRTELA